MERKINQKLSIRLLVLLCLMGAGLIVASVASALIAFSAKSLSLLALITLQDVLAFILPAIAAMAFYYHKPLHVMCLDRAPGWNWLLVVVAFYVISLPAMNWLVNINEGLSLPSWMSGIEQWMRATEDAAAETTRTLLDIHTTTQLVATIFVVGFMAGLSEEILFRGTMMRTMQDSRLGNHAAVWIAAIVFSAIHLQFYGFIPRMLLGLWFGYLLVWTRSLWAPIIAHTLNNSTVVLFNYLTNRGVIPEGYGDHIGIPAPGEFPWLAVGSLVISIAIAICAHRYSATKGDAD